MSVDARSPSFLLGPQGNSICIPMEQCFSRLQIPNGGEDERLTGGHW